MFSISIIAPDASFEVTRGTPQITGNAKGSTSDHKLYICGSCASALYAENPALPGSKIVRMGCLDDAEVIEQAKPVAEFWTKRRPSWLPAVEGAIQNVEMERVGEMQTAQQKT